MRNIKRLLCSLMAVVMCLGMLPSMALAAETPPYDGDHSGSISVTTKDTVRDTAIQGVTYQLEDITAGRYQTYELKTTTANGTVSWTGLSSGVYRVTQTKVPDGYILDTKTKTVYVDTGVSKDFSVQFRNQAENALYIYRFDPAPDTNSKPLAGATFEVRDTTGKLVERGTTGDDGYFVIAHIPQGEYLITEVAAPNGYNVTPDFRRVVIVPGGDDPFVVDFSGSETSSITIINRDHSTLKPIPGSHWKITDADGTVIQHDLVTNNAGIAHAPGLEPGTYIISQTRVADSYIEELQSTTVKIEYRTQKIVETLYNTAYGSITPYVTDKTTDKPLAGAIFTLYDEQGRVIQGPSTSRANGSVSFSRSPALLLRP